MQYDDISITLTDERRTVQYVPGPEEIVGFGAKRSDHMFLMDFDGDWEKGHSGTWDNPRIVDYHKALISTTGIGDPASILHPGSKVFHYGYSIFEGAKAFLHQDNELYTFRLHKNAERFNCSARIMNMPSIPEEYFVSAVNSLLDIDRLHFPKGAVGASLYIRPFMFGSSDKLGVGPGDKFTFGVFLSPSGPYYDNGFNPISLLYQTIFHRATPGGVGGAKAAGNYAGASRPGTLAKMLGASQCLFVDAIKNKLCEEVGTSALGIVKSPQLLMPKETDTILGSITAGSARKVVNKYDLSSVGISYARREEIDIDGLISDIQDGSVSEVIGLGTAAVISPVKSLYVLKENALDEKLLARMQEGRIHIHELLGQRDPEEFYDEIIIGDGKTGPFTQMLFDIYTGIQNGTVEDRLGFMKKVERNI
ncbi:branched-chain amino acid aminotransferase [archaeon]|jgi:branched-chain amino acid aminotransferase|nr:branched-chain amino acid aminotransferase [archaeon]